MTDKQAMKMALEALEAHADFGMKANKAIHALRQALAQPEHEEPSLPPVFIGVDVTHDGTQVNAFYRKPNAVAEMFYSEFHPLAPPKREWVGLTDDEMKQTCYETWSLDPYVVARAIEAKLKEKNNG